MSSEHDCEFKVVPGHQWGPAVIRERDGWLVDNCPSVDSAVRVANALNEAVTADPSFALPAWDALEDVEKQRVHRALMRAHR